MGRVAEYGRGHPYFLAYVQQIVQDPAYEGMPDVFLDGGRIQWEAPSNRPGGKYQLTHQRRLDWWRRRARSLGLDPATTPKWISRTAKLIHPTKRKPCKNCGRELAISYVYPSAILLKRIDKLCSAIGAAIEVGPLTDLRQIVPALHNELGPRLFKELPGLLKCKQVVIPALPDRLEAWLGWIEAEYIPIEPSTLSPGVMSNAPDRLDGFHSFNRCCRHKADTGRSKANLQSYGADRRAFEYWVDGNWVVADTLMGLIRSHPELQALPCRNQHPGPCAADHIGPISLGFRHRPEFQFLCRACNSAKNNRLTLDDVLVLRGIEARGEEVSSWYCAALWRSANRLVTDHETAVRLSKLLRDNRHTALLVLGKFMAKGHLMFLCTYLGLEYPERRLISEEYVVNGHTVGFRHLATAGYQGRFVSEQKARRIRVAFGSLASYQDKVDRNAKLILPEPARGKIDLAMSLLSKGTPALLRGCNSLLVQALRQQADEQIRLVADQVPSAEQLPIAFSKAKALLTDAMESVAETLLSSWEDPRYARAEILEE